MNFLQLLFTAGVSAGGWNRRVYYDSLGCKGNLVHGIMVWQSPNCAESNPIVNSACENKSTVNPYSSEGTSCETISQASDSIYFPPLEQAGKVPVYVTVNKYTGRECSGITDGFEQSTFAADGKCYADERGSYFKATCNGQSATVFTYCKDATCNECSIDNYDGSCQTSLNGLALKSFCTVGSNITSQPGSGTTAGPGSATNSGSGSTGEPEQQNNSVSSPDGTLLGFALSILAAMLL